MRETLAVQKEQGSHLLSAYGRKKLLGYADSFRDLAQVFMRTRPEGNMETKNRQERLWSQRLTENQTVLADHLNEIAKIITNVAEESYRLYPLKEREQRKVIQICKNNGIFIRSICWLEDDAGGMKLSAELRTDEKHALTVEDAADLLSALFHVRLIPEKDTLFFITREYMTLLFEQEARYHVMTGAAKATRENETVSGDTYSFIEKGNGNLIVALSDGMGSGEKAMRDSETVIDFLEKFIEAGFSKETAVEMINGALLAKAEEGNMSTLDLCDINLYTGSCELIKIGSSYTYLKKENEVEQVSCDSLPLGIFPKIEMERQRRQLKDGDYIIMLSDGVMEGIGGETVLKELLEKLTIQNPQEMAGGILQFVLRRTEGRIQDDMTVLVTGIWENVQKKRAH